MSTKVKTAMDNAQDMIEAGVDTAQQAVARTADRADELMSSSRRATAETEASIQAGLRQVRDAVHMATRAGARALGLEHEIGSIEAGKRADLILVAAQGPDPYSTIVYASRGTDVRTTIVDGEVLIDDFRPVRWDSGQLSASAREEARALAGRANFF